MVTEINQTNFNDKINNKCLVDFYATWCSPCKMLEPIMEEISEELTDLHFYKINVDENLDIAEKYGVNSIPTIILFNEGKKIKENTGFLNKAELKNFII